VAESGIRSLSLSLSLSLSIGDSPPPSVSLSLARSLPATTTKNTLSLSLARVSWTSNPNGDSVHTAPRDSDPVRRSSHACSHSLLNVRESLADVGSINKHVSRTHFLHVLGCSLVAEPHNSPSFVSHNLSSKARFALPCNLIMFSHMPHLICSDQFSNLSVVLNLSLESAIDLFSFHAALQLT
jgi:hypothetical protein